MAGTATQDVFGLLPKEWEGQQFGEVGTDQGRSRNDATRDVTPIGTVQAIADGGRLSADARGKGCLIAARMATEDEV